MKKRSLSLLCAVAIVLTMLGVGTVLALTPTVSTTTAFSFDGASFVKADWTVTNNEPTFNENGVVLSAVNDQIYATVKYKDNYDLSDGFTLEYSAKAASTINFYADSYYAGVQIGNIIVGMDRYIKPVILVGGEVKTTGENLVSGTIAGNTIRTWIRNTEPAIDGIKYTVTYDADSKTLTYAKYHGETQAFSIVYNDADNLINIDNAYVSLYHNNSKNTYATYKSIKLDYTVVDSGNGGGDGAGNDGNNGGALVGTGVKFNSTAPIVESDWTASGSVTLSNDKSYIDLATGDKQNVQTYTYNTKFNLTDGFSVSYNAGFKYSTGNYSKGYVMGVKVGNMIAALKEYSVPTILIDNVVVAQGDVMGKTAENYDSENQKINWLVYRNYLSNDIKDCVYKVVYEPATKTITFGAYVDGSPVATIATYTDTEDKLNVTDASFALYTTDEWDQYTTYKNVELIGKPDSVVPGPGDGEGGDPTPGPGDGGDDPAPNPGGEPDAPIAVLTGVGVKFGGSTIFESSKWTPKGDVAIPTDKQGNLINNSINVGTNTNVSGPVSLVYNDKFNLTGGFVLSYDALCRQYTGNYSDGYVMGAKIGNITVALKEYATPTILIDNVPVATGDVIGKTADNFDEATGKIKWTQYAAYMHSTGKDIIFKAEYDADTKTLTFGGYLNDQPVATLATYTDTDSKINVSAAEFALYTNDRWDQFVTYTDVILVGGKPSQIGDSGNNDLDFDTDVVGPAAPVDPSTPAFEGLAVKFDKDNLIDESQWTGNGECEVSGDKTTVRLAVGDTSDKVTYTYNTFYNLSKGFKVVYSADCKRYTGNYSNGYVMGAKVGNVIVALKEYATPVILIDGKEVAAGDVIAKNKNNFDEDTGKIKWSEYKEYLHSSDGLNTVYKAVYNAETKTITFGAYIEGRPVATLATYTDTEGKIKLSNAQFALYTTDSWDQYNNYYNVEFYGYTEPEPDPGELVGEELKETWAPENLTEAEWEGDVKHIVNGEFNAPNDNAKYVISTKKSYNLSKGFAFKGTLLFKNSYTNYYGEYCSVTFGDSANTLELRIRNNHGVVENDSNSYTAYLVVNGEEIASSDLMKLPNGEYELKYHDGKVIVSLGGNALQWKLADGTEKVTAVIYDGSVLKNAKMSLRLVNNWCTNGRKWSQISLSPLSANGVVTGDSRTLVVPVVVLLVSAIAAAFVLNKKKVNA